ncbi:MAG: hypothetical protein ACI361_01805 [Atopobiaceae bacterium]
MVDINKAAEDADVIINGFAVVFDHDGYKVINLNTGEGVSVFDGDGTLIESNMDEIELGIATKVLHRAMKYSKIC